MGFKIAIRLLEEALRKGKYDTLVHKKLNEALDILRKFK